MSGNEPTELLVAVHFNPPRGKAVLVSIDGTNGRAVWIGKNQLGSFHLTGGTTLGTNQDGNRVTLPLANITIPEWLAIKEGLV